MVKYDWISGTKFGQTTLTGKSYVSNEKRFVEFICVCNKIKWARFDAVKKQKSCGCINEYIHSSKVIKRTHGLTKHPLYVTYRGIRDRCYLVGSKNYPNYGAKGVVMCDEWRNSFKAFYDWCIENGWKKGLEVDKDIKYNAKFGTTTGKIYSPEFCSIVTRKNNAQYKSTTVYLEYNGKTQTVSEWSAELKINRGVLYLRLFNKWSIERTLSTPLKIQKSRLLRLPDQIKK